MSMIMITIKNNQIEIDGTNMKIPLMDIGVYIHDLAEVCTAEWLYNQILDYEKIPNKFSLARKMSKYKITDEQKKNLNKYLADRMKIK